MPTVTANIVISIKRSDTGVEHRFSKQLTLADTHEDHRIIAVGTSEETITINSDIANKGYMFLENLDPTNYIDLGYATGDYEERIRPGTVALVQLAPSTTTFYVRANTAECDLKYYVTEEPT